MITKQRLPPDFARCLPIKDGHGGHMGGIRVAVDILGRVLLIADGGSATHGPEIIASMTPQRAEKLLNAIQWAAWEARNHTNEAADRMAITADEIEQAAGRGERPGGSV
jgi:hypothetical protein